jgi:hypothetical protein
MVEEVRLASRGQENGKEFKVNGEKDGKGRRPHFQTARSPRFQTAPDTLGGSFSTGPGKSSDLSKDGAANRTKIRWQIR